MAEPTADGGSSNLYNIVEDVLYPFREYQQTTDFISRNIVASFTITLIGLIISVTGLSPGIGAAIGGLGFAPTALEIILRIIFNEKKVLQRTTSGIAGLSIVISSIVAFIIYTILGPGSFANLSASLIQFGIGIIITYIAGVSAQVTMTALEAEQVSLRIRTTVTIAVTIAVILFFVFVLPGILSFAGLENASDAIAKPPAEARLDA